MAHQVEAELIWLVAIVEQSRKIVLQIWVQKQFKAKVEQVNYTLKEIIS